MKSFVAIAVFAIILAAVSADFGYDDGSYMVGDMGGGMGGMGGLIGGMGRGMGGMGGLIGVKGRGMGGVGVQYPYMNAAAPMCNKNHGQMLIPTQTMVHVPAAPMVSAGHPIIETTNVYAVRRPGMVGFPYSDDLSFDNDDFYGSSQMFGAGQYGGSMMSGHGMAGSGMYGGSQMMGTAGQFGGSQMYGGGQMAMIGASQYSGGQMAMAGASPYGGGQMAMAGVGQYDSGQMGSAMGHFDFDH